MQPGDEVMARSFRVCFSTLYGSKWVATLLGSGSGCAGTKFQYPLRVEVGCKSMEAQATDKVYSFSTLYGSKWVATKQARKASVRFNQFQYPLRVEVGCNRCLRASV